MRVADLIQLLQQHDPAATVVLWDCAPYDGHVSTLGFGEVEPIQLGTRELNGLLFVGAWEGVEGQEGPFPGVVLGSRQ